MIEGDGEWVDEGMNWEEWSREGKKRDARANTWGINAISSLNHLMTDSGRRGGGQCCVHQTQE